MNVGIIGLGSISAKHIHAIRALYQDVNIFALRSSPDASTVPGVQNIQSLSEVVDLDFVIISNPTSLHYETVKLVADYGFPMIIEKPAFFKLDGVAELQNSINEKNITTYLACNLRFNPCLIFLKENLRDRNEINEVNIYCGSYLPDWRPDRNYKEVYSANLDMGGGVHLDLFHEVDYACWIFGLPKHWSSYTSNSSTLGINAPDYANYLLKYNKFNINIVLNYYRRKPKRSIEILFEDEIWLVDLLKNKITNDREELIFEAPNYTILDTYVDQMGYFVKHLTASTKPMNDINETIRILEICLAND